MSRPARHSSDSDSEEIVDHDDEFSGDEGQIKMPSKEEVAERKKHQRLSMSRGRLAVPFKVTSKKHAIEHAKGKSWTDFLEEDKKQEASIVESFAHYKIGNMVGSGSFGKVYRGLNVLTGQFVAIKEISLLDKSVVANELPKILKEIDLLKDLDHPNIVKYVDYNMVENKCLHIVLEYMENGSLKDIIKKFGFLPEKLTARYSYQILKGLEYLHSLDILHRDIKGANILTTKDGHCKLADFGVATKLQNISEDESAAGTTYWMAPEIFESQNPTPAADIWSFGCTVIELLTGAPPYRSLPKEVAVCNIIENDLPPFPPDISLVLKDFLISCFKKNPLERGSANELLQHPWIVNNTISHRRKSTITRRFSNIHDVLRSYDKQVTIDTVNGSLDENEIKQLVSEHSDDILQKLIAKREQNEMPICNTLPVDTIRTLLAELEIENSLLLATGEFIQDSLTQQLIDVSMNLQKSNFELEESQLRKASIAKKISILEESFAYVQSDYNLAKLIYGSKLPISHFTGGIRGVLLLKKAKPPTQIHTSTQHQSTKHKWKKRWILLQDNFFLCYKVDNSSAEPVLVIRLQNHKIVPVAERDIGKKFTFLLSCGRHNYYCAAASPLFLMKWINLLSDVTSWYQSEDDALFHEFDFDGSNVVRKSESLDALASAAKKKSLLHRAQLSPSDLGNKRPKITSRFKLKASSLTHKTECSAVQQ